MGLVPARASTGALSARRAGTSPAPYMRRIGSQVRHARASRATRTPRRPACRTLAVIGSPACTARGSIARQRAAPCSNTLLDAPGCAPVERASIRRPGGIEIAVRRARKRCANLISGRAHGRARSHNALCGRRSQLEADGTILQKRRWPPGAGTVTHPSRGAGQAQLNAA